MPGGRPTIMTEIALAKLDEAFSNGATDLEACFIAEVSKDTLYNYQKKHPKYVERKEGLKNMIKYQAKKVVKGAIEQGDKQQANWYLERKAKNDGFSTRTEITGFEGKDLIPITEEKQREIDVVLDSFMEPDDNKTAT